MKFLKCLYSELLKSLNNNQFDRREERYRRIKENPSLAEQELGSRRSLRLPMK